MMKKLFTLFVIFAMSSPMTMARVGQPSFVFAIDENPAASTSDSNKSGGLSGGAVTAITLGSIGGAALLGLGGWLYKRKLEQNLAAGCIRGASNPLVPFCIDENPNSEFYARINNNYPYLKKALSLNEIHYCPHSKYILIYDTKIEKGTFDSIKFEIPNGVKSIKVTHVTDPFEQKEMTVEMYLLKQSNMKEQPDIEVMKNIKNEITDSPGIIMKTIPIDSHTFNSAIYVISNYSGQRIYGIVFEFIF